MPKILDNTTVDGTVTADGFSGPLTGTASRATADASGNTITTTYATKTEVAGKQDALVSGTNIKTVNGTSLLGSGDITIGGLSGTVGDDTHPVKIVNGQAVAVTNELQVAYDPTPIEVFSTTIGVTIQVRGFISYHRIGPKKGLLSGTLYISSNSATSLFNNLSLNNFGNALGVSFKNPSSNRTTGKWFCLESGNTVWSDGMGYGSAMNVITDGTVQIGRYYNDSGAYGAFPMSTFSNAKIVFDGVYLEEN